MKIKSKQINKNIKRVNDTEDRGKNRHVSGVSCSKLMTRLALFENIKNSEYSYLSKRVNDTVGMTRSEACQRVKTPPVQGVFDTARHALFFGGVR
ncbi:MAG TPA: hypothetical protein DCE18_15610 [Syntrophobacteraceae bacterium]|jgi:hypothetical protein|nr:hypothetical protein [Syntrophobacteraceae bacterium]